MTDIVQQSRQAREKLAAALQILQTPEAGTLIDSVAEPVARAMGALHQIESSKGLGIGNNGVVARDCVREALAALQGQPESAVADEAMAHIAGSLGLVHQLAEASAVQPAPKVSVQPKPAPQMVGALDRTQLASDRPPASDPPPAPRGGGLDATLPTPTRPSDLMQAPISLDSTQASVRSPAAEPEPEKPRAAAEPARKVEPARREPSQRPSHGSSAPSPNSKVASLPPEGMPDGALSVEANLGAHSPTNFYKGLSGNDVVDDGGLFIATYDLPALGSTLWVEVHMPGGYEFAAVAEVRWTRESGVGDAPPGYGCAFKSVSKEARQLIYRYVRNREPMFYDDL